MSDQFSGRPIFLRTCSQVFFTKSLCELSCLIFMARIMSSVSLVLRAWFQHVFLSDLVCCQSCITCSHLRTQMRWAASEIRICRCYILSRGRLVASDEQVYSGETESASQARAINLCSEPDDGGRRQAKSGDS